MLACNGSLGFWQGCQLVVSFRWLVVGGLVLFIVWIWLSVGFCGLVVFVLVGACVFLLCGGFDVYCLGLVGLTFIVGVDVL